MIGINVRGWRAGYAASGFAIFLAALPVVSSGNGNVHVSRFWHNHQPIYWPEWNGNGPDTERVQFAWDSIVLKPGQLYDSGVAHPENNLVDIFGKQDRVAAYQGRPRDSLNNIASKAGYAISYSGSLIDNIHSLGSNNQLGYGGGWWDGNRQAAGWMTPSGSPRLDPLGFTHHHSLGAVLPKEVLRKEIQVFKEAWQKAWNINLSNHSKGFFPTEMAFSTPMVDVLVDEGYEWVIVASHHVSRTCPTYNQNEGDPEGGYQIKSSPPNKADQLGPSPTSGWWFSEPNPGQAARNVSPFGYQLHKVKYVDPKTGSEKTIIAVPSDDALSYVSGYSGAQIGMISGNISPYATDPARPVFVMPATDGDNAWGGGYDSWMVSTPSFFGAADSSGYNITTPQDFVDAHGAAAPVAHIEDGAWIFPESAYGAPYFLKWVEPPLNPDNLELCYPGTKVDLETPGFALKFWSWSPVIAGANWCETAEQIYEDENGADTVAAWKIHAPYDYLVGGGTTSPNVVERAWHIYLAGLDSGFNYYGGLGNDDEVKQSLATRRAVEILQTYMSTRMASDTTPPTVFKPQRFPWNPGWYTFGWFNSIVGDTSYLKKMPSEFYVWTHAYDVNGITNVTLKVRIDGDGVNTLANNDNETYAGGPDVGSWVDIPMTMRSLPSDSASLNAAADNGQINYFSDALSPEIADYYFAKITDAHLPGFRGKLLDYTIEAYDGLGNKHESEIQHVWVEDDGQGNDNQPSEVNYSADPRDCDDLTITYKAHDGPLSNSVPVTMWFRFDSGDSFSPAIMDHVGGGTSTFTVVSNAIPDNAPLVEVYFVNVGATITDNNGGANWSAAIRDCEAPVGPATVSINPPHPNGCGPITVSYYPNTEGLQGSPVNIHIGHDGFKDLTLPNPPMTWVSNHWEYVYTPTPDTFIIDMAFNDGLDWDNNNGNDWHFDVVNCVNVPAPDGVVITNPPTEMLNVSNAVSAYDLEGTAGEDVTGSLQWSNELNESSGTVPLITSWLAFAVPLAEGTNTITVCADTLTAPSTVADDEALDGAYSTGWSNTFNGGTGWGGGWTLTTTGPNAGHFLATGSPDHDSGTEAWGMYANSGDQSVAVRPFASALTVGQVFSLAFENGTIENGSAVGFMLQNAAGSNLVEFVFTGGESNFEVRDELGERDTGLNWRDTGFDLSFELTGADTYHMAFDALSITGSLLNVADQEITRFQAYNNNAGPGGGADFFLNHLELTSPGSAGMACDTVKVVRAVVDLQDGIPVWWWQQYGLGPAETAGGNSDADPATNGEEWLADTDPTDTNSFYLSEIVEISGVMPFTVMSGEPTTNSRVYDVWVSTSLRPGDFQPLNLDVPGAADGSPVELPVNATTDYLFMQTGVKLP